MAKLEKKIQKDIDFIKEYLDETNELQGKLEKEDNAKKRLKITKKIDSNTRMTILYIKELKKWGVSENDIIEQFNADQQKTIYDMFPEGFGNKDLEKQKQINYTITRHKDKILKIQKAQQKYAPYDPSLPVEQKLENEIYKLEKDLGKVLFDESDKNNSIRYNKYWNYLEDMPTSTEFSEEERIIMDRCYLVGKEYDESGLSFGDRAVAWGNKTQAQLWCKKFYTEIFVPFVEYINLDKEYTNIDLINESKELTKQYIEFSNNEELKMPYIVRWNEISKEVSLSGVSKKEVEEITSEKMSKEVGKTMAMFTYLEVTANQNAVEAMELIGQYTFEELGLE